MMAFRKALYLSCLSGILCLAQEIIWVSIYSYHTAGRPQAFAHVLGFFLIGVALGTYVIPQELKRTRFSPLTVCGFLFGAAGLLFYFLIMAASFLFSIKSVLALPFFFTSIVLVSALGGGIFPLLPQFSIEEGDQAGPAVAWLYAANIFGAVLGPLLVGYFSMEKFGVETNILFVSVISLSICAGLFKMAKKPLAFIALFGISIISGHRLFYGRFLERIHPAAPITNFRFTHQSRHGIINIQQRMTGDVLFGGGVYDGHYSTDPHEDVNGIRRAYAIMALHPQPKDILQIGLGTGSWTRAILYSDIVERLSIVEINPGYLELLKNYSEQAEILVDPRVLYHTDDGRRWLRRHPNEKFDFVLQNTTYHWRNNATNLVSAEYMTLVKSHLNKGGVFYLNTTGSDDIVFTATQVFQHVVKVKNFVAMSDAPFSLTREERLHNLSRFRKNGTPFLIGGSRTEASIAEAILNSVSGDLGPQIRSNPQLRLITDDNMLTEFKTNSLQSLLSKLSRRN
jgi:spermidine synthase